MINATEKGEDLLLSGTSNQPEGTTITVTLNGIHYTATADASGNWSVTVPAANVSALGEANYTVTANVTDSVGNSASTSHDVLVDSSLPVVTIDTLAGDNIVNAAEVAAGQTLTGKVTNAASGDTVTIMLGGLTYMDWVIGETSRVAGAPTMTISPLGLAARDFAAILTAQFTR